MACWNIALSVEHVLVYPARLLYSLSHLILLSPIQGVQIAKYVGTNEFSHPISPYLPDLLSRSEVK
jgi:hypothetical protein